MCIHVVGIGVVEVNKDCRYVPKKLSVILVPLMRGHLRCTNTLLLGPTGVPKRQVPLYIFIIRLFEFTVYRHYKRQYTFLFDMK